MSNYVPNQLITDLARDLITEIAPQELPIFRANSAAYFADPARALKGQAGRDDPLGFGAGEVVVFLTPVALAVVAEIVAFLTVEVKKSVAAEGAHMIGDLVKGLFKRFRPEKKGQDDPPPLTPAQLRQIRKLALEKALQLQLPYAQAKLLADAMVGSLAATAS